ncbi:D-alanyl-D-alanine carboxypeptidase family protein [Paenibacillus sp. CAU 1782]
MFHKGEVKVVKVGLMQGLKKNWSAQDDRPKARQGTRRQKLELSRDDVCKGTLLLVNRANPVTAQPLEKELEFALKAGSFAVLEENILLERECLGMLARLIKAAGGEEAIMVTSGYRTRREQEEIYESSLAENGPLYTSQYVALPGCSEHQTGLAVDVGLAGAPLDFIAPAFPDEGACLSFKKLAARYGFIQRYKEGKESITSIACEPWHFRYVGVPHSELIQEMDVCLEEYLSFIKAFTPQSGCLTWRGNGEICDIMYVEAGERGAALELPDCDAFTVSGNNMDGYVITMTRRLPA